MKLRNFFMGLGILPIVLVITVMLSRPVYATAAMMSGTVHVLVLMYLPTGESRAVALFPSVSECKLGRDIIQAEADSLAPGAFVAACLPTKLS